MECPFCKEEIKDDAIKCKHCGSLISIDSAPRESLSLKKLFFSFQGRINRSTLWLKYYVPYIGIYILTIILDVALGTFDSKAGIGVLSCMYLLVAIWPSLAVGVKRCHDRNRTGWFLLIGLIPLLNIWPTIEILFLRGTKGINKYGSDPTPA